MNTSTRTADEIAADILEWDAWFNALDPSMKDELSQPNHDHHLAKLGVELARAVQAAASGVMEEG